MSTCAHLALVVSTSQDPPFIQHLSSFLLEQDYTFQLRLFRDLTLVICLDATNDEGADFEENKNHLERHLSQVMSPHALQARGRFSLCQEKGISIFQPEVARTLEISDSQAHPSIHSHPGFQGSVLELARAYVFFFSPKAFKTQLTRAFVLHNHSYSYCSNSVQVPWPQHIPVPYICMSV